MPGSSRRTARRIVRALAAASGEQAASATPRRALANFRAVPPRAEGDVYYVLRLPWRTLSTSCSAALPKSFKAFWDQSCEYIWVEAKWACDDRGLDVREAWKGTRPDFFHLAADGLLSPVHGEAAYRAVKSRRARASRRFAWVDRSLPEAELLETLRERLRAVLGKAPPRLRLRV